MSDLGIDPAELMWGLRENGRGAVWHAYRLQRPPGLGQLLAESDDEYIRTFKLRAVCGTSWVQYKDLVRLEDKQGGRFCRTCQTVISPPASPELAAR